MKICTLALFQHKNILALLIINYLRVIKRENQPVAPQNEGLVEGSIIDGQHEQETHYPSMQSLPGRHWNSSRDSVQSNWITLFFMNMCIMFFYVIFNRIIIFFYRNIVFLHNCSQLCNTLSVCVCVYGSDKRKKKKLG